MQQAVSPHQLGPVRLDRLLSVLFLIAGTTANPVLSVSSNLVDPAGLSSEEFDALLNTALKPAACPTNDPLVCAHGGNAHRPPALPNTMPAFHSALEQGFSCVETDVARTRDGYLVAVHVRELRELSADPAAQAADFTWTEMQALQEPAGHDSHIPLLADVVQLLQSAVPNITLDVKLKEDDGRDVDIEEMAHAVVALIKATSCSQCLVWSKNDELVRRVQALHPGQRCGFIIAADLGVGVDSTGQVLPRQLRPACEVVGLHHAMVDEASVRAAHASNQAVHAWTANTIPMMVSVLIAGADAVVTSFPEVMRNVIERAHSRCRTSGHMETSWQAEKLQGPASRDEL